MVLKQRQIEEYEVNPFTLFIKPKRYGNKVYSQIIEVEDEFLSPLKPLDIIKNSCFGSDYEGCRKGSMLLINAKHKIPIAIDPTNNLFSFLLHHRIVRSVFGFHLIISRTCSAFLLKKH